MIPYNIVEKNNAPQVLMSHTLKMTIDPSLIDQAKFYLRVFGNVSIPFIQRKMQVSHNMAQEICGILMAQHNDNYRTREPKSGRFVKSKNSQVGCEP
jgi:hypothetical protein